MYNCRESTWMCEETPAIRGPEMTVRELKKEPAGKPGSVVGNHSSGTAVTSILKRPTRRHRGQRHGLPIWSCSRWGLPCRKLLPVARCALTAPFHPYRYQRCRRYLFCCTFRRLAPPRRYLAPCPVEPGLSSFSPVKAKTRLPGRLPRVLSSTRHRFDSDLWELLPAIRALNLDF